MKLDYKKAYEELVEQIKTEHGWAIESLESHDKFKDEFMYDDYMGFRVAYDRGIKFAYESILSKIKSIEEENETCF